MLLLLEDEVDERRCEAVGTGGGGICRDARSMADGAGQANAEREGGRARAYEWMKAVMKATVEKQHSREYSFAPPLHRS